VVLRHALWDNVRQVFTYEHGIFLRWTANSFLYAGVGSLGGTLIALATGYGLARFEFPAAVRCSRVWWARS